MNKLEILREKLYNAGKVCVAFSGGVDSAFLLRMARETLGENVIAVIADGVMVPRKELADAVALAGKIGVQCRIIEADVLSVDEFRNTDKRRCYYCKKYIFGKIIKTAAELGFPVVMDGKNADDNSVYRPGQEAARELGVVSPLSDAGLTKTEIRKYSREFGLPTWNKPSNACLATRLPYGAIVTAALLSQIEACETILEKSGITGGRARLHGDILRIEANRGGFSKIIENESLVNELKSTGIKYITLDLEGYRSGSMDD